MEGESHPRIRILDEKTINQIAAGEVIENAASVIKELIENAIDAKATQIEVETKAGGRQLIRVSDNGWGMKRDDVFLCIERHATSKIGDFEDLHALSTLGFRGEALPSIASVSKLSVHTAPSTGEEGTLLVVEGGKIIEWRQASRRPGTTIEVKSLFFNVPVRKKFQKSLSSETADIHKILIKTGLSYPALQLTWKNDEKMQLQLFQEDVGSRIAHLFGEPFFHELIPMGERDDTVHMTGFISRPTFHRANRMGQYLFINGRPIHSPVFSEWVGEGYGHRLPIQRYPAFVLYLQLLADEVDVNVHPQKKEVRFSDKEVLRQRTIKAIETTLEKRQLTADKNSFFIAEHFEPYEAHSFDLARISHNFPEKFELKSPQLETSVESSPPQKKKDLFEALSITLLGWIGPYALVKHEEHLQILDPQAARRRVFYESSCKRQDELPVQTLLFPITLSLDHEEAFLLESSIDQLTKCGIHVRLLSGNMAVVDAIPSDCSFDSVAGLMEALLEDLKEEKQIKKERVFFRLCGQIGKKKWTAEEITALMGALQQCEHPNECPLGKRTLLQWSQEDIEKEFS